MTIPDHAGARPPPWGYAATLGFALLAAALGFAAALVAFFPWMKWYPDFADLESAEVANDARVLAYVLTVTAVVSTGVVALAARIRGWPASKYLGLVKPDRRRAAIAAGFLVVILAASEALTYLLGFDIETQFDRGLFLQAKATGTLPLLWYTLVVVAPVGEEVMFRGFLQRGWVRSRRGALPAIVIISAIWASLHTQYDWYGMVQIFELGLLFGWVRQWSGSTLLTMLLHALANGLSSLEELLLIEWFS
jgi:membrane protease YdiL (CAAX protease family)